MVCRASLSHRVPGAVIYYTTDGSEPNENGPAVSSFATLIIDHTLTLKAKAIKPGWPASQVKTADFVINGPPPTPTPTPVAGAGGQEIAFARSVSNGLDVIPDERRWYWCHQCDELSGR